MITEIGASAQNERISAQRRFLTAAPRAVFCRPQSKGAE